MNIKATIALTMALAAALSLTACSSINLEEMEQLDADGARGILMGKTQTFTTDYGNWAEYTRPDQLSGVGKAWGSWGAEKANSTHTIADSGEVCTQYEGEYDWSTDEHQYCAVYYSDAEGKIYFKATKNTRKPERVGKVRSVAISDGDKYGLIN